MIYNHEIATKTYFYKDALDIAPAIIGQYLVKRDPGNTINKYRIKEIEVYRGPEDGANHARKGKTARNRLLYEKGGIIYIYLIYGMHWMLNIVTGDKNDPQAILIRAIEGYNGPGKLTKGLHIDGQYNGITLEEHNGLWIAFDTQPAPYITKPRIGIAYANHYWRNKQWRYILSEHSKRQ